MLYQWEPCVCVYQQSLYHQDLDVFLLPGLRPSMLPKLPPVQPSFSTGLCYTEPLIILWFPITFIGTEDHCCPFPLELLEKSEVCSWGYGQSRNNHSWFQFSLDFPQGNYQKRTGAPWILLWCITFPHILLQKIIAKEFATRVIFLSFSCRRCTLGFNLQLKNLRNYLQLNSRKISMLIKFKKVPLSELKF